MDYFPFIVEANQEPMWVPAKGQYIRYLSVIEGGVSPQIEVRGDNAGRVLLLPGQSALMEERNDRWEVRNYANEVNIRGILVIGERNESVDDGRVLNDVLMIDGGKARSLSGAAFASYARSVASPGNYSCVQLFNHSTDKRVVIESFYVVAGAAGDVVWGYSQTQLATHADNGFSKLAGGDISTAVKVRIEPVAAPFGTEMFAHGVLAGAPILLPIKEPIVLPPGWGFHVRHSLTNTALLASFEHFEESNV